jgi:TonB family protein
VKTPREEVPGEEIAPARASVPITTEKRSIKKNATAKVAAGEPAAIVSKEEDIVVPPKLVKAIRSLSPPEALWKYTSGNVVLDVLVNETGHVESAIVISGPKALHQRAITTVKDYLYQPATKNGKPVTAHVQVKIQFWYEP